MFNSKFIKELPDQVLLDLITIIRREMKERKLKNKIEEKIDQLEKLKPKLMHCETRDEYNEEAKKFNTENYVQVPQCHRLPSRLFYFKYLDQQDWSFLFKHIKQDGLKNYYVYFHIDPRKKGFVLDDVTIHGLPFYVGKGQGARAQDLKRNEGHGKLLRKLLAANYKPEQIVLIFRDNLTKREALELESKLIHLFGTIFDESSKGILLNLKIEPTPDFIGRMMPSISRKAFHTKKQAKKPGGSKK